MKLNVLILGVLFIFLAACGPESRFTVWVGLDGNDDSACSSEAAPCLTLAGALEKVQDMNARLIEAGDGATPDLRYTINVAAGTYNVTAPLAGDYFARVDLPLDLVGAGRNATIFDAANTYGGILVEGDADIYFKDFTIQNVAGANLDGCIHTIDTVRGLIEDVTVQQCLGAGIIHNSEVMADTPLELSDVISKLNVDNPAGLGGHGVVNNGAMQVLFSAISHNDGLGLFSSGYILIGGDTVVELNDGSGMFLSGQANLDRVSIRSNGLDRCVAARGFPCGEGSSAGIRVIDAADVSILSSTITRNLYGIYLDSSEATLTLVNSSVGANQLPGVYVKQGSFRSQESVIGGNATDGEDTAFGLVVEVGAVADLTKTRVDNNQNGGVWNLGELDVIDSSISENEGSRAAFDNRGTATLENTLIGNNQTGAFGSPGGVINHGTLDLLNVTISQNLDYGVFNAGSLTMAYSTIYGNDNVGLVVNYSTLPDAPDPSTSVENSIILGNEVSDCSFRDASLRPVLSGFNIETSPSMPCGFSASHAIVVSVLEALADNGGFTMTNALVPDSPALDAALGDCPATDQRLVARPAGSACDVGAYEASEMTATLPLVAETATPDVPLLIVLQDSGCFYGPGLDWPRYSTLAQGTQAEIVGQGFGGGWMVIKHPTIANTNCWIDIDHVDFDIPLDELRLISIPARPTPAATATKDAREPTACPTNPQIPGTCQ